VAHIDHGKSTLADRLLEMTGRVGDGKMREQYLDQMDLERERGITIKASAVRLEHKGPDGDVYVLNLIDTPGHVDFSYEVSRALAGCEAAILVVDAAQGVEAQTVANYLLALEHDLEIIPVINKIDLPSARPDVVKQEIFDELGLLPEDALAVSAKTGEGCREVLDAIVERVPPPRGEPDARLRALVFDSKYDPHQGVIGFIRVVDGSLTARDHIKLMQGKQVHDVEHVGIFDPEMVPVERLSTGDVGYVSAGVKDVRDLRVGDTVTSANDPATEPLPGYRVVKPVVFCGLYPVENKDHDDLRDALEKLQLNDAALTYEREASEALGFGFRAGFLGLLHLEIVQERLEREFDLSLIATCPNVVYRANMSDGEIRVIDNPADFPDPTHLESIEEPYVKMVVMTPEDYVGPCMDLCETRRGTFVDMRYGESGRVYITYELPLAEVIVDFFDYLKSRTRGYATMDYEILGYRESDMVRLDILINEERVDALTAVVHRTRAYERGREIVDRMKEVLPRQQFKVKIQAALSRKVIAATSIAAFRKNVTSKCYGGDITRKRKLLERQKEGKKRLKMVGSVEVPQEAFMAILKRDE
jgi:GTP-binding protein LepA